MPRWSLVAWAVLAVLTLNVSLALAQTAGWDPYPLPAKATDFSQARGSGYYLSIFKLVSLYIVFAAWVKTTDWVSQDCLKYNLNYTLWNSVVFGVFLGFFFLLLIIPWFYLSYFFLLCAYGVPLGVYIWKRNKEVPPEAQVLTKEHIRYMVVTRLNKLGFKIAVDAQNPDEIGPPIRLRAQGAPDDQTNNVNLLTARQSPGYILAREMIHDALGRRADAIMLDYGASSAGVRYQIDGFWHTNTPQERAPADQILAVIKTLANLNPQERRAKQAGAFGIEPREGAKGPKLSGKISTQGTETGERALVQMIDPKLTFTTLESIGMRPKMEEQLMEILGRKNGFVIFCSMPAGGLTTSLDVTLNNVDRFIRNFSAIEDVAKKDRDILNVALTTFNAAAGETPMDVLPKLLRTYPDVLVVRDMVNGETVDLLLDNAAVERLVYTTVRAKEAVEALLRVMMLKPNQEKFSKYVTAVLNTRVCRKLCEKCKESYTPPAEVLQQLGLPPGKVQTLYRPRTIPAVKEKDFKPCEECSDLGYKGRTGIFELLVVDDLMRRALATQPKLDVLRAAAKKSKHRSLQDEGLLLVAKGVTSVPELLRVLKV